MYSRKLTFTALIVLITICALALPAFAAEKTQAGNSPWTIYINNQVRWGSNDRTIFTLDLLVPLYQGEKNILFFAPRLSKDDRDGSEVNFGFGYRHLLFSDKAVLGVNGYYDARWTGWGTRHEQAGIGAEVMTDWVTGRINGYFPITDPQIGNMGGASSGYFFRDIGLYLSTGSYEETLGGFDAEVGFKIPGLSKYVETWVYAGGYHFQGDYVKDVNGFSSRVEVIPTDFLRLNFEYRNDTLNHDQYYGEVAVAVPFSIENLLAGKNPFEGIGSHIGGDRTLKERMVEPVRRDIDVQIYVAGDGAGGTGASDTGTLVEDIVFVSEIGDDLTGDGTFELPYKSIDWATNDSRITSFVCNIIHVINDGDGSSAEGGSIDVAGLTIWGSGVDHPLYPIISNMTSGYPDVVAYNGNSFVLSVDAADTTITGLGLTTPSGPPGDVYGINLNNGQGLEITYNEIGSGIMNGYGIYSNLIGSNIGAPGSSALFAYNNIELVGGSNATGIYLGADNIYADFTANMITGSSGITEGITLVTTGDIGASGAPVTFNGNIIDLDCAEIRGITYTAGLADYDVTYIDFAGIMGGDFSSLPAVTGSGSAYVSLTDNVITESGGVASLGITGIAVGDHVATLTDNTIVITDGDISSGILLGAGNGLDATITDTGDVNLFGVYGDTAALGITGVGLGLNGGSTHLDINHNTLTVLSGVAASGILAGSGAGLDADITFNNVTGTGGYAAVGITALGANYLGAGGTTDLLITDNILALTSPGGGVSGILAGAGGDFAADIISNTITGDGLYAALGITALDISAFGTMPGDVGLYGNTINLNSAEGGISGILVASLGDLSLDIAKDLTTDTANTITGYGKYAALGITGFGLTGLSVSVYDTPIGIESDYFASGILMASGGYLYGDIIRNSIGGVSPTSAMYGDALALGITLMNYDGDIDAFIDDNVLNVQAEGAGLPVYEIASFIGSYIGGIIDPAAFDSSPYEVGVASGIMELSVNGDIFGEINENLVHVDGLSLAAGVTTASLFGDLGSYTDPISILGNTVTVDAVGGGDVTELVSDLAAGFIGSPLPWNGYLEGYDGGASGIAMLTTGRLHADMEENTLDVSGGLGALGVTAFGYDLNLGIYDNDFTIDSGGVSSGILMMAMEAIEASIYGNDAGEDALDTHHISGAYGALGITGIALATDGGSSYIELGGNDMYLTSGGVSSGVLLASLGGLGSYMDSNTISAAGIYAALGITQFGLDYLNSYQYNDSVVVESDYFASGILSVAGGDLYSNITGEDFAHARIDVSGDAFALGVTLLSVNGNISNDLNFVDLNVTATGTALDVYGAASFLSSVPYVGSFIDPTMFEATPYNVGVASGIMELSVFGDTSGTIQSNNITVQGQSLAAGITVASIFGGIGQTAPLNIGWNAGGYGNTINVTANGGGDLFELVSDLVVGYTGLTVPWSDGALLGYDGAAFGITMATGGNLVARVENNYLNVSGALGAFGITAFGNDLGASIDPADRLQINYNSFTIDSPYVSSGILMVAMNRLNATVYDNNMGYYYDDETYINGGYAALGITGIALNLTDDGNYVYAGYNHLALGSENGITSGILLASLNNLNFDVEYNDITHYNYWGDGGTTDDDVQTTAKYAALGITAISGDDIGYGTPSTVSNNYVWTDADYVSSGILLLAADELIADVSYNAVCDVHNGANPIRGDVAALGISLLSYGGDIDASVDYNSLNLEATGATPLSGDLLAGVFGVDPAALADSYNLGFASGILVASYSGDVYAYINNNGTTALGGWSGRFFVQGNTLASGITLASWDGALYSEVAGNYLMIDSPGTGPTGIDALFTDVGLALGDPVLYPPLFSSVDGTASGITLLTANGGIYSEIHDNPLIDVEGNSMAMGILAYTWDNSLYLDIHDNPDINVASNGLGAGIFGIAGMDLDDGTTGSGILTNNIFANISDNSFDVTADEATAAFLFASGWIGSDGTTPNPLLFNNNTGTISGTTGQVMMMLVGMSGTAANPNYVDWSGTTYPSPFGGTWSGIYPIAGSQIGAFMLDPANPLDWGWNITPLMIP